MLLIMHAWISDGLLPDDDRRLMRIARMNEEQWIDCRECIRQFFVTTKTGLRHKRIDEELAKAEERANHASIAGKASAAKRAAQRESDRSSTRVQPEFNPSSTNDQPEFISRSSRVQPKGQPNFNSTSTQGATQTQPKSNSSPSPSPSSKTYPYQEEISRPVYAGGVDLETGEIYDDPFSDRVIRMERVVA
jgi:uncharacterized protein YdaU (DUF1376 family)